MKRKRGVTASNRPRHDKTHAVTLTRWRQLLAWIMAENARLMPLLPQGMYAVEHNWAPRNEREEHEAMRLRSLVIARSSNDIQAVLHRCQMTLGEILRLDGEMVFAQAERCAGEYRNFSIRCEAAENAGQEARDALSRQYTPPSLEAYVYAAKSLILWRSRQLSTELIEGRRAKQQPKLAATFPRPTRRRMADEEIMKCLGAWRKHAPEGTGLMTVLAWALDSAKTADHPDRALGYKNRNSAYKRIAQMAHPDTPVGLWEKIPRQ